MYSTLSAIRMFWSLLRRGYELFFSGFNWLLTACAAVGYWWVHEHTLPDPAGRANLAQGRPFMFLAVGLGISYLLLLSVVGGAILPRYLLPILPFFYLLAVALVMHLPRFPARVICLAGPLYFSGRGSSTRLTLFLLRTTLPMRTLSGCTNRRRSTWRRYRVNRGFLPRGRRRMRLRSRFSAMFTNRCAWFHCRSSLKLSACRGNLTRSSTSIPESGSRRATGWPSSPWLHIQARYFDYRPQFTMEDMIRRYHLGLLARFERRGQWVRIYGKQ